MALLLALSLAGFDKDDFRAIVSLLSPEQDARDAARRRSPSARSESSGISSLVPSTLSSNEPRTPSLSPVSSRSESPNDDPQKVKAVGCEKRDILNLAGNLSDPAWKISSPSIPSTRHDQYPYAANRSIYYRLGNNALTEDYPVRQCQHCGFTEPSPYLF